MSRDSIKENFIVLGVVIQAHGLKGTIRVRSFAESPQSFEAARKILLRPENGPERWTEVEWTKPHPKGVLLKLNGIDTPEKAGLLKGAEIGVDRCDLPDLQEGEYFWADLIGLEVLTSAGQLLGRVVNMFETGANDVMVVQGARGEVLIPAVEAAVAEVDFEAGRIILAELAGLVPEETGGESEEEAV